MVHSLISCPVNGPGLRPEMALSPPSDSASPHFYQAHPVAYPFLRETFQYLGRISYSLYLVHGPVMRVFADTLYAAVGWKERRLVVHSRLEALEGVLSLPSWGPLGMEIAFLVPQVLLIPLTFGLANFVTWAIDKPTIKLSRWLYRLTLISFLENGRGERHE